MKTFVKSLELCGGCVMALYLEDIVRDDGAFVGVRAIVDLGCPPGVTMPSEEILKVAEKRLMDLAEKIVNKIAEESGVTIVAVQDGELLGGGGKAENN